MEFRKDRTVVRDGETIKYVVAVANDAPGACTVSSIDVKLQLPSAAGPPELGVRDRARAAGLRSPPPPKCSTGPIPTRSTSGTPRRRATRLACRSPTAERTDTAPPYSPLTIDRQLQTPTLEPSLTIGTAGSTTGGVAPQTATYAYAVKNTTTPLGLPEELTALSDVIPKADRCGPLTYAGGDTNDDELLAVSETWTYTCTATFNAAGTVRQHRRGLRRQHRRDGDRELLLVAGHVDRRRRDESGRARRRPRRPRTPAPAQMEAVAITPPVEATAPLPMPVATTGPRLNAALTFGSTRATRTTTKLTSLVLGKIPAGSTVVVACRGTGCDPRLLGTGVAKRNVTGTLNLKAYIKRRLGVGAIIKVTITRAGNTSVTKTLTIRSKKAPLMKTARGQRADRAARGLLSSVVPRRGVQQRADAEHGPDHRGHPQPGHAPRVEHARRPRRS